MADRRAALRALIARLERLPASERRTWMLAQTRARISDLETGSATEPMRPFDTGTPERGSEPPPRAPRPRPRPVAPPEPKPPLSGPEPPEPPAWEIVRAPSPASDQGVDKPRLDDEDVLSLDDADDDPPPESSWRRGLRG